MLLFQADCLHRAPVVSVLAALSGCVSAKWPCFPITSPSRDAHLKLPVQKAAATNSASRLPAAPRWYTATGPWSSPVNACEQLLYLFTWCSWWYGLNRWRSWIKGLKPPSELMRFAGATVWYSAWSRCIEITHRIKVSQALWWLRWVQSTCSRVTSSSDWGRADDPRPRLVWTLPHERSDPIPAEAQGEGGEGGDPHCILLNLEEHWRSFQPCVSWRFFSSFFLFSFKTLHWSGKRCFM